MTERQNRPQWPDSLPPLFSRDALVQFYVVEVPSLGGATPEQDLEKIDALLEQLPKDEAGRGLLYRMIRPEDEGTAPADLRIWAGPRKLPIDRWSDMILQAAGNRRYTDEVPQWLEPILGPVPSPNGPIPPERPAKAVKALEKVRAALKDLGPTADSALSSSLSRDGLPAGRRRLMQGVEAAISELKSKVNHAPEPPVGNRIAKRLAEAYCDIVGDFPPKTNPYADTIVLKRERGTEHPWHKLVRQIFDLLELDGWQNQAMNAAKQIRKNARIGSNDMRQRLPE